MAISASCLVFLAAAWAASLVLAASYVPLMGKFLPFLLGERVAIEDIYR